MLVHHSGKIINIASTEPSGGGTNQLCRFKGGLVASRGPVLWSWREGDPGEFVLPGMIVTGMSSRVRKRAGEEILDRILVAVSVT